MAMCPSGLLDDPVNNVASPRPVPLPSSLVVKNGSNTGPRRLVHPAPVSVTAEHGVLAGPQRPSRRGASCPTGRSASRRSAPAVGHGVAGVEDQVHEHLLDLAGVGVDPAQVQVEAVATSTSSPITRRSMLPVSATTRSGQHPRRVCTC